MSTLHSLAPVVLGMRANWRQFALLMAVNAFVGGMVGLERAIVPLLGEEDFGVSSTTLILSFVAAFGAAKACANLAAGRLSETWTRRRILIAGWLLGLPVPFLLIWAPSWGWIAFANILLGLNQGLCWSMTVNMKLDLAGDRRRGAALGLNEAAGYLAVAASAYASGLIASRYGLRPEPFYLGIAFAALGLGLSTLFVKDTAQFVRAEATQQSHFTTPPSLATAFARSTWGDRGLMGISQAGFVNNLNDALAWGIFPLYFAVHGLDLEQIGLLAAVYPLVWAFMQLGTGWFSDQHGRKSLIVYGMVIQAAAIATVAASNTFALWFGAVALLGLGTAMVYPTLLAAIGDTVHPFERATTLGVYRFWRDMGAVVGALMAGLAADILNLDAAILLIAVVTAISAIIAQWWMDDRRAQSTANLIEGVAL